MGATSCDVMESWILDEYDTEYELFSHFYDKFIESKYIFKYITKANDETDNCELHQTTTSFVALQNPVRVVPPKLHCENDDFLNVCNTAELKTSAAGRKYIQAHKTLFCGLLVARERPQILYCKPNCVCMEKPMHHCHYCGQTLVLFEPCENCELCVYCDKRCRENAWKQYHRWECNGMRRHYWDDMPYFAMRILFLGIPTKFHVKRSDKITPYCDVYSTIQHLRYVIKGKSKQELCDVLKDTLRTLIYLIEKTNFFHVIMKNKIFPGKTLFKVYKEIGWRLVKHQFQAIENVLSVAQYDTTLTEVNDPISYENKALCVSLSLFNHSCQPNAVLFPVQEYVLMKTLRKIKYGEEIQVNYCNSRDTFVYYSKFSFKEKCTCSVCQSVIDNNYAYRCIKKKCNGKILASTFVCTNCKTGRRCEDIIDTELQVKKLRNKFNVTKKCELLYEAITKFQAISHKNNIKLANFYLDIAFSLVNEKLGESSEYFLSALKIYETLMPKYAICILHKKLSYAYFIREIKTADAMARSEEELRNTLEVLKTVKDHLRYFHLYSKLLSINFEIMRIKEMLSVHEQAASNKKSKLD